MNTTPLTTIAERLYDEAFTRGRPARSDAYKAGVRAALRHRIAGIRTSCPYRGGTAEFDAFFAGWDEGARMATHHRREQEDPYAAAVAR